LKILFAIQGTGNGHLSRARDIYPELARYGDVDVLISGIQADVDVPFPVKHRFYGMSFIFGKSGGVDMLATARKLKLGRLIKDIRSLPVKDYDLVINDFEPVSAWACKINKVPCISVSHQCAVLNPKAPRPDEKDWTGETVLKYYAPVTAEYGFHFKSYGKNIFTPVIRKEIRALAPVNEGHYTVYLPAYDDEAIVAHLSHFDKVQWQVFSKHNKQPFTTKTVHVQPIENTAFVKSMASSEGVLCGAGFEGPAEALYLGKKLMVIPMTAQYEQQCNAAAIATLGVPVIKHLGKKYYDRINWWLMAGKPLQVSYPDITADIIAQIMQEHAPAYNKEYQEAMAPGF
jgi:uncharacterized protein (TIGR00661 family)